MKVAGLLTIFFGFVVAFLLAVIPVQIAVFGAQNKASCGLPVVRVLSQQQVSNPDEQRLIDACEDASAPRLRWAGAAAALGAVVGTGLLVVGQRRAGSGSPPPPPPSPPPPTPGR